MQSDRQQRASQAPLQAQGTRLCKPPDTLLHTSKQKKIDWTGRYHFPLQRVYERMFSDRCDFRAACARLEFGI